MMTRYDRSPRVAIVHEWLTSFGAEKVLEQILEVFPQADIHAVADVRDAGQRGAFHGRSVRTSFIQKLPLAVRKYKSYLFLMPLAVEGFDMSGYDIVISSSHAVAKGVITGPDQLHVCYCHTPIRYAWDLQHQYLREAGLTGGPGRALARLLLHYMRMWDLRTANGVDLFVANSGYIARRIHKTYRRQAHVIYPPVDVASFAMNAGGRDDYYIVVSRLVPYKRVPLIVEAFANMPDRRLVVVGGGPGLAECERLATPNISLLGHQPADRLRELISRARAFVFAAEEDFGIAVVEAQACGTPVICFGKGGATETVIPRKTGVMFHEQSVESIQEAVRRFERVESEFEPLRIRENAERFRTEVFREQLEDLVMSSWRNLKSEDTLRAGAMVAA